MKKLICLLLVLVYVLFSMCAYATDVSGGRYKVGEDIPEGDYSISFIKKGTNLTVWGSDYDDYRTNGGLLLNVVISKENKALGKVVLKAGNVIDFSSALKIEKFKGLEFDSDKANKVWGGRYTVGVDIPAGSYTISVIDKSTNLTVWGADYGDYQTNGGLLLNVVINKKSNPSLGKVILEEGNVIDFESQLLFEKYTGLSFD